MVAAPAARSMRLVGAIYGNAFSAERLIECGSVDCFLTSSNGYSLWAHYSIIVDWLGARIPRPNLQNQIILPISDSALRLLIDIIYHRKNYSGNKAILELIDYSLQCGWFQLMDDLLTNGFEEIEIEGLPRCWILARERNLECELSIRQRVGDNALTYIRQHSYGSEDFLSIPIEALLDLIDDDNISWPNGKTCLEVIFAWSLRNPRCAISYCKELFSVVRFKGIRECHTQKIEFINFFKNLGVEDATLRDATNGYLTMKPRLPRSLLVFMGDHWSPIPSLYLPEKLSYFKCQIIKN
uniref:BACK domain-containing protein n=1 Tax=Panagrolaimus sp. ES5 TaxID=591445 RepID=A0AC34FK68_9BILA